MAVNTLIQIRRGTSSEWFNATEELGQGILYRGEWGYETDTGRYKIGDGSTAWNSLGYAAVLPTDFTGTDGIGLTTGINGSGLTIAVTGIQSTQVNDFTTAVQTIVDADSIDTEQVQDIVGQSGVTAGYGILKYYNDTSGLTYISITGTPTNISAVSGLTTVRAFSDTTVDGETVRNYTYTVAPVDTLLDLSQNLTSTASELNVLDGVSPGTVSAGDAVVVDGSKNITGFNNINAANVVTASGGFVGDLTGNADTASQVKTVTTDTGTHYLAFVDSDNVSLTDETLRTDGDLTYNAATNLLSVGKIATTGSIEIGGDLNVAGTTTTVNSTIVEIGDNIIRVNTSGLATGGIEVQDGSTGNYKQLVWNNSNSRW